MFPSVILKTSFLNSDRVRYCRLQPPFVSLPLQSLESPQSFQIVLCTSVSLFQLAVVPPMGVVLWKRQRWGRLHTVGAVLVVVVVVPQVDTAVGVVPRLASAARGG